MRRMMIAGAGALALLALTGCAETNSWFGSPSDSTSGSMANDTGANGSGTSGTTLGDNATDGASGTSMIPPTTGNTATKRANRGAGMSDNAGERNRAFYPGTLGGNGLWRSETDAPGGN